MAYEVMAYVVTAYRCIAYTVIAYVVMAYIVMALCRYGLHRPTYGCAQHVAAGRVSACKTI